MINEAKTKLTRLGMALFYFYICLAIAGCVGVIFGLIVMILKLAHIDSIVDAPVGDVIALIVVSYLMIKFFRRESVSLLETDSVPKFQEIEEVLEQEEQPIHSNIIAFTRSRGLPRTNF